MTEDLQEYLQIWEKDNNPFYPEEMRWDRLKVNNFLIDYKQQLTIPLVGESVKKGCWCGGDMTYRPDGTICEMCS